MTARRHRPGIRNRMSAVGRRVKMVWRPGTSTEEILESPSAVVDGAEVACRVQLLSAFESYAREYLEPSKQSALFDPCRAQAGRYGDAVDLPPVPATMLLVESSLQVGLARNAILQ